MSITIITATDANLTATSVSTTLSSNSDQEIAAKYSEILSRIQLAANQGGFAIVVNSNTINTTEANTFFTKYGYTVSLSNNTYSISW